MVHVRISGMSHVCLRQRRLKRLRKRLAFLLLRPRSLPDIGDCGKGGLSLRRPAVDNALAPVSPRGSAPRLELFLRRRMPGLVCPFCSFEFDLVRTCARGTIAGNGSDAMLTACDFANPQWVERSDCARSTEEVERSYSQRGSRGRRTEESN